VYLPTGVINPIPMSKQVLTNPVPTPLNPISFFSGKIKSSFGRLFKKRKDKTNKIPTSAADSMGGRISQKGKDNKVIRSDASAFMPKKKEAIDERKASYQIGNSDGGPGTWEHRRTPEKGAEYQQRVTGAPRDVEYVVKVDKTIMPSGEKKFDGYDPATNTLIDAKDWKDWPPNGNSEWAKRRRKNVIDSARKDSEIAKSSGSKLEWRVSDPKKAKELSKMFAKENIDINVVYVK